MAGIACQVIFGSNWKHRSKSSEVNIKAWVGGQCHSTLCRDVGIFAGNAHPTRDRAKNEALVLMSYMTNPNSRPSNHPLATLNYLSESFVDDATPLTEFDSGEPPKPPRRRPPTGAEFEPTYLGKRIVNVMEELVQKEALAQLAEIEATSDCIQKLRDIVAYVLNRVPPLYATTKEGAEYQQQRARDELQQLISQQVTEAIAYINRP